ncbi:NAD(P)H-dependent flavin oxidoreductase [Minwuia thermotolerans]|uniref:2-nitropropane dioxygenase n=1 Tax=Minwuia thermotolerans TaxID=2056226 RepID=A0A2M9G115_9PROT|nr:nitronate monooxygenase [Minwuia thermotolerans]PJK29402.1 2-nitropropane dioxygenase [Minwuia thermotolerans]
MSLPPEIAERLKLPLIAAPMFLVSGPDLVIAACRAGVIGSFPTANCRTVDELDQWLERMGRETGEDSAPIAPNLIVHRTNTRLPQDLEVLAKHRPPLVIASVGSPEKIVDAVHGWGGLVLADIASMRHAEKAIAAGADGLILLTGGAGGQTGWANPFAFVRGVRRIFDGPVVLAGGVGDGRGLRAAEVLGCDLAYMGTRFIATAESMAADRYKQMLVESGLDDIKLTNAITGLDTSILKPSLLAAGLDPDNLPERGAIEISKDINPDAPRRWKDIWSAGHSVELVDGIAEVADVVAGIAREYHESA